MTEAQLHEKRHARTLSQREKRRARLRAQFQQKEADRRERIKRGQWLADIGKSQQDAAKAMEDQHRQALESRRTNRAMSSHTPKGFFGRVKAFFQRRTP